MTRRTRRVTKAVESTLIVPTLCVGMQPVTLRVTCRSGRRASIEAFPRRAWERSCISPDFAGGLGGPLALECSFRQGEIGMVFSSNVFLFLFLPIFLGLYYLSGQRYRNLLLLIASY